MKSVPTSGIRSRSLGPALLALVLAALWGFIKLADEVVEQETRHFDQTVLLSMRESDDLGDPIGPARLEEAVRDVTALGSTTLLTAVTLIAVALTRFAGRRRLAWIGLGFVVVGALVMSVLKRGFDRPRPELVEHATLVHNPSFPSGHSTMAAMVYLTLGILLSRTQARRNARMFIVVVSLAITFSVGISRVYLGVHWPTDVLGGWLLGGFWALLFWWFVRRWDRRHPPSGDDLPEAPA